MRSFIFDRRGSLSLLVSPIMSSCIGDNRMDDGNNMLGKGFQVVLVLHLPYVNLRISEVIHGK